MKLIQRKLNLFHFTKKITNISEEIFKFVRTLELKSENQELNEVKGDSNDMNMEGSEVYVSSTDSDDCDWDNGGGNDKDFQLPIQ